MKGAKSTSTFEERRSGGGTMSLTFILRGGLSRFLHLEISGNWFCRIRMVLGVAVAVIRRKDPPEPLNSPDDKAIAGLNARFDPLSRPQLATRNINLKQVWL
jgi:hypothetical protein